MKTRTILSASALALALGVSSSALAANKCGGEIQFDKGKSSATITGKVAGNDICEYTFYAKKGQELLGNFAPSDRPQATLYSPVNRTLANDQAFILPQNGKYELRVGMTRNDARKFPNKAQPFTMNFSIGAPQQTDSRVADTAASGYVGEYEGILPCTTCRGVETYLALYDDGSFTLSENYLGRNDSSYTQQGTWMTQGDAIVLESEDNEADSIYLFGKGGDVYFVSKEEAGAANPKVNQRYRLQHQQ